MANIYHRDTEDTEVAQRRSSNLCPTESSVIHSSRTKHVPRKIFFLLILLCTGLCSVVASAQDCNPPAITANSHLYNIFSPEQEMVLGELNYQRMSGDSRFIQ